VPTSGRVDPSVFVAGLVADLKATRWYEIGFPGATDLTFPSLAEVLTSQLLNNIGDPHEPGHGRAHTKTVEQHVVAIVADFMRAPGYRWGYVTTGATEATIHALHEASQRYPDVVVYTSSSAHYSVAKAARMLKLPLVTVRSAAAGHMDIAQFRRALAARRGHPAMVVATAGTTMTEAVDDVAAIASVCDDLGVARRRIHVDAALSGLPLALLPEAERPAFDFAAGATSMAISGHKFLGTLMPCGVLVYAGEPELQDSDRAAYVGSPDTTIVGSRSGHTPLLLWWALTTLGTEGMQRRAAASRDLAQYAHQMLRDIGWPTKLNPFAFTVTFKHPPPPVVEKWALASDGDTAHIVCMPGVVKDQIDEFVADLNRAAIVARRRVDSTAAPRPRRIITNGELPANDESPVIESAG
jgi:histidine decarboxylase